MLTKLTEENEFPKLKKIDVMNFVSNNNHKEDGFSEAFNFGKLIVSNDSFYDLDLIFKVNTNIF